MGGNRGGGSEGKIMSRLTIIMSPDLIYAYSGERQWPHFLRMILSTSSW